jgi:hypothetical protein
LTANEERRMENEEEIPHSKFRIQIQSLKY